MLLVTLLSIAASTPDTLRLSCAGGPTLPIAAALAGRYTLRTTFSNGEQVESSTHTVSVRDSSIDGRPALVFDGYWQHLSGRESTERIVFCRDGLAPFELRNRTRPGLLVERFGDRMVRRQLGDEAPTFDSLPASAFPYSGFYVIAALAASLPGDSIVVPLFRDEENDRNRRFQWALVEATDGRHDDSPVREVIMHAFGGATHFVFRKDPLTLLEVRLDLTSGDTIQEIRIQGP